MPDATFRAVKDRRVTLVTSRGPVGGKLLGLTPDSVTIVRDDGEVVTIARADVTGVRLTELASLRRAVDEPPPPAEPAAAEEPEKVKPRTFGVHLGMAPGVAFDVDYQYFHAFASTSWLFPLVSSGVVFAFAAGMGATFPIGPHWRFDVFAHAAPLFWQGGGFVYRPSGQFAPYVGLGVGMGLHYTSPGGLAIGVKLPLIGGAVGDYGTTTTQTGAAVGAYYLACAMSFPVFSFGYRF